MRSLKIIFSFILLGLYSLDSIGCDKSFCSINYISELSPGVYQMQVDWCVGTTTGAGFEGGSCVGVPDGSTYEMEIRLVGGAGVNATAFNPISLISSETGNTATGSISATNSVLYATSSSAVLMHDGGASSTPNQYCYSSIITFSATTVPTSIELRGLEDDCGATGAQVCGPETATIPPLTPAPTCNISSITAGTQSVCNPDNNMYSQQVTITYSNAPGGGLLDVNGQTFSITSSPQTVTLSNLNSDAGVVDVTASFTSDITCSYTENDLFTAPSACFIGCDFSPTENLAITPNGDHNSGAGFTQVYILTDLSGVILSSNGTGNFGPQSVGEYNVYALNYETTDPPTLPVNGANISTVTGGCSGLSPALGVGVCIPSVLSACENSGDDIFVAVGGYNTDPGFNQVLVIVNNDGNEIVHVDNLDINGTVTYSTTSLTGDLLWGNYTAYSVNYEDPETLVSLGLAVTNTWTGAFGAACVDISSAQIEVTAPASCIAGASVLTACQDLGEDIVITSSGFNGNYDYDQFIIMVDSATNTITSIKWSNEDTDGIATFNTTGGGSLPLGTFNAYSVNFEYLPGAAFYGLTVGATWPPNMNECIDTSGPSKVIVENCAPLPFNLMSFNGDIEDNYHLLKWKYTDFTNLNAIELQLSSNSKDFRTIKKYDGNFKFNNEYFNYNFYDEDNYYRLKVINEENGIEYSNVINLKESKIVPEFSVFPNPTSNHQIHIISNIDGEFNFKLTDVAGRTIMDEQINFIKSGSNTIELSNSLSNGLYLATISSNKNTHKNIKVILK